MVRVAILHEGNSKQTNDNKLLKLLIKKLNLNENRVEFFGLGTKGNFFKNDTRAYKELLVEVNEKTISKILFVVDADYEKNDVKYGGFNNTLAQMIKIRQKLNIYEISDLFISCNFNTKDGYLESLILSSIPQIQKECIETFLDCSEFKSKENDKAILNQIYESAYPNKDYDFSHSNFDILKQKLNNLFEEQ